MHHTHCSHTPRQHIDGHVDGPVRALIQADLVTEDVVYQDQAVQLTGVHKWLQYMKVCVSHVGGVMYMKVCVSYGSGVLGMCG